MVFAVVKCRWLTLAVLAVLIAGALPWSAAAQACTATTDPPGKPTNFTATVNEEGILLQWDAAAESDKVFKYDIYRKEETANVFTLFAYIQSVGLYELETNTYSSPPDLPTWVAVNKYDHVESGQTYDFVVVAVRMDNCGADQESEPSDAVTATFPEF